MTTPTLLAIVVNRLRMLRVCNAEQMSTTPICRAGRRRDARPPPRASITRRHTTDGHDDNERRIGPTTCGVSFVRAFEQCRSSGRNRATDTTRPTKSAHILPPIHTHTQSHTLNHSTTHRTFVRSNPYCWWCRRVCVCACVCVSVSQCARVCGNGFEMIAVWSKPSTARSSSSSVSAVSSILCACVLVLLAAAAALPGHVDCGASAKKLPAPAAAPAAPVLPEAVIEEVTQKQLERILAEKEYVAVYWCKCAVVVDFPVRASPTYDCKKEIRLLCGE